MALSRWGLKLIGTPRQEDDLQPAWAMVALQSSLQPEAASGLREAYEFRVDGELFHVRVEEGEAEARQGRATDPDLIVSGDTETLLSVAAGRLAPAEAVETGALQIEGDREALARCLAMLGASRSNHRQKAVHEDSSPVDTL